MKRDELFFALNETTHALRFAQTAARRFSVDPNQLEAGSATAVSVAYISNRLSDAQGSLSAAETEIAQLLKQTGTDGGAS